VNVLVRARVVSLIVDHSDHLLESGDETVGSIRVQVGDTHLQQVFVDRVDREPSVSKSPAIAAAGWSTRTANSRTWWRSWTGAAAPLRSSIRSASAAAPHAVVREVDEPSGPSVAAWIAARSATHA